MQFTRTIPLLFAALLSIADQAYTQDLPKPRGFVNDFASVIDSGTAQQLEADLDSFRRASQVEMAVVTIPSLGGWPIEDYALKMAREWGIGGGEQKEGVLVLVAIQDRGIRIEISRHLEGALPDGLAGAMAEEMRPYFRQQQYGAGLTIASRRIIATIAKEKGIQITGVNESEAYRGRAVRGRGVASAFAPLLKLIFAIIVIVFALLRFRRGGGGGLLTAVILSNAFGSGRGSFGGGGEVGGGSDWGGFGGGGDFGGGGASSDW